MSIIAIAIAVAVITAAIVVPWTTIDAFEFSRRAGWLTAFVAVACHVAVWWMMASHKEAAFFLAAPWAAYEFILTIIPAGIVEMEEDEKKAAAEATANKG
ncbi:MAG: hypothetical protein ACFNS6_00400 [Candidatus Saccharimonas sp.]